MQIWKSSRTVLLKMFFQNRNNINMQSMCKHRLCVVSPFVRTGSEPFLHLLPVCHTLPCFSPCTATALGHKEKQETKANIKFNNQDVITIVFKITFSRLPSDGFDLADKVGKFAGSCVWQKHTEKRSHCANGTKNKKWQNLHVHTCKQNRTCIIETDWACWIFPV